MQQPILYLIAANDAQLRAIDPREDLKTAQELRELRLLLHGSELAGRLDAQYTKITEPQEMLQTLRKYARRLQIVHFMGHAAPHGLWLHNPDGGKHFLAADYLNQWLRDLPKLGLVILNGCRSQNIGAIDLAALPFAVIGTTRTITDHEAQTFTVALYKGLLSGEDLQTAFRRAHGTVQSIGLTASEPATLQWDPNWDSQPVYILFATEPQRTWKLPLYKQPQAAIRTFGNVLDPQHFVGRRKELDTIHAHLGETGNALLLGGMGGIGKTTLARYYWHHPTHAYATQIWLSAAQGLSQAFTDNFALLDFLGIAERMDILRRMNTPAADLRNIVWNALQAQEKPILLVIDNLNEAEDRAVLRELTQLHHRERLHLIYTSRQDAPHTTPIRIGVLPPHEALALFYEHYAMERNDSLAQNLLHTIGGHTLLIELLAKTASEAAWPLTELVARLQARGWSVATAYEVDTEYAPIAVSDIKAFVRTLFDFTLLTETETEYLRYLSVFPTEPIAVETLTALCLHPNHAQDDTDRLHSTLVRLSKRSLVNTTHDHRNFWLHPVLAELLREKTGPDLENCGVVIGNLIDALGGDGTIDPQEYQPIIKVSKIFLNYFIIADHNIAIIYNKLGICLVDIGLPQNGLEYLLISLQIRKKIVDPMNYNLGVIYNNIGVVYKSLGYINESFNYLNQALEIYEAILPHDNLALAMLYDNLGGLYAQLGNSLVGLDYQKKAIKIIKVKCSPNHITLAYSYSKLANRYGELGEHNESLKNDLLSLKIFLRILTPNHIMLGKIYDNIGATYFKMGNIEKSLKLQNRAMSIFKNCLPTNHSDWAILYNNIGKNYQILNDNQNALMYFDKAFQIVNDNFPKSHPTYITIEKKLNYIKDKIKQEQAS